MKNYERNTFFGKKKKNFIESVDGFTDQNSQFWRNRDIDENKKKNKKLK